MDTTPRHSCEGYTPFEGYGSAIEYCVEEPDGRLFAGNGEYISQVAFCPYCGVKARVAPPQAVAGQPAP